MYTKKQLLAHITNEFRILKHLWTKITTEQHLGHKFTDAQRSVRDLMVYLGYSFWKQLQLVVRGEQDMSVFADMGTITENFDPTTWSSVLDTECNEVVQAIEWLDDDALATEVSIFSQTKTRAERLIALFVANLAAYKMQLFLQLKHAGQADLNSMNLWGGVDKPSG